MSSVLLEQERRISVFDERCQAVMEAIHKLPHEEAKIAVKTGIEEGLNDINQQASLFTNPKLIDRIAGILAYFQVPLDLVVGPEGCAYQNVEDIERVTRRPSIVLAFDEKQIPWLCEQNIKDRRVLGAGKRLLWFNFTLISQDMEKIPCHQIDHLIVPYPYPIGLGSLLNPNYQPWIGASLEYLRQNPRGKVLVATENIDYASMIKYFYVYHELLSQQYERSYPGPFRSLILLPEETSFLIVATNRGLAPTLPSGLTAPAGG